VAPQYTLGSGRHLQSPIPLSMQYTHLGRFSDWPLASRGPQSRARRPELSAVRALVEELIVAPAPNRRGGGRLSSRDGPAQVRVERTWQADGVAGEEVSYSVGYGPRTWAWLLKPAGHAGRLPGVLALHSHDAYKYYGKEKVADGPEGPLPATEALRRSQYGSRAFANDLARRGFVVLAPDVFCWGSRRFEIEEMPSLLQRVAEATRTTLEEMPSASLLPPDVELYNAAAWHHEHLVEKYCSLLGTTMAAVVAYEDRLALHYLLSRPEVSGKVATIGLSGGGCRSALLRATSQQVTACAVVGMMSTYDALLDHNVFSHTWMFMPAGLAARADWPDLAACGAPSPLLVQYNRDDPLFPLPGQIAAHRRIAAHYRSVGAGEAYTGRFYDGPHKFDQTMQDDAFAWLSEQL
jgi:dienelactone hydrolase